MVASLQCRKEALEAKLKDKTNELKKLCFEEAELTGILPVETPLEPGEVPPHFPRRIGTAFALPENLIDKLYSKEDRAIASLELECQIQTGIAEAALGIVNDGSSSRSVRRRHKLIYQESQRKLFDLEAKLNTIKHCQNRQQVKQKPSPVTTEGPRGNQGDKNHNTGSSKHETLSHSLSDSCVQPNHHYHSYNSLSRANQFHPLQSSNDRHGYYSSVNYVNYNNVASYQPQPPYTPTPYQPDHNWYVDSDRNSVVSTQYYSNDTYESNTNMNKNRCLAIERNGNNYNENYNDRMVSTLPRNNGTTSACGVLLPGQTYPDNSLIRTQSLGNVTSHTHSEKKKEKQWYETSLDCTGMECRTDEVASVCTSPVSIMSPTPTPHVNDTNYSTSPAKTPQLASINNFSFEMVVPYESPKNHTVIEAGKWQPYREVTKPFEMSDFYKYSTKFRKGQISPALRSDSTVTQQKAIYQPLQPQECQPLNYEVPRNLMQTGTDSIKPLPSPQDPCNKWYNEKPSNSSTLV